MERAKQRLLEGEALVAGVLSGTSADGMDVALGRLGVHGGALVLREVLALATLPWEPELGARVRACLDGEPVGLRDMALLHRDLGLAFGGAVDRVAKEAGARPDLVGSHGQTVYHHDGVEPSGPATLQLGDGDWIAERVGCPVVSDFRQRDVAAGGGGAPLSAYGDDVLFPNEGRPRCILNLGGMANISWLDDQQVLAFDTGPAGALLDGLARRLLDSPLDQDGRVAAQGTVDAQRLAAGLEHPFFALAPPKSTGRDTFGESWIDGWLAGDSAGSNRPADLLATGVALIAESVARAMETYLPGLPQTLWVAGGGVHNRTLLAALGERLGSGSERTGSEGTGCRVASAAEVGVDPDGREALLFAVLAARWVLGEGVTRPTASGAAQGRILGKLSPGYGPGSHQR